MIDSFNEKVYGKFYWMEPIGKLHRITKSDSHSGHAQFASEFIKSVGLPLEKDVFKQMYNLGWIRVAFVGDQGQYTVSFNTHKQPSNIQIKKLKDLAIELNADEIRNNSNSKQRF